MRPKLTYANVVATLALFIALGGASYAALKLPKNSVGPKQLKKNAVTGTKVKDDSLTGADIDEAKLGAVPTAAFAGNTNALMGLSAEQLTERSKLHCPSGTQPAAAVCVEDVERTPPATFTAAMVECAKSNRRLPTVGELGTFDLNHFREPPNPEWVEPTFLAGAITDANILSAWGP
jgi:hypothetical protein